MSKNNFSLSTIANSLSIGVLIVDDKGKIGFSNKKALKILDLDCEDILNKKISDIFSSLQVEDLLKTNIKSTPSIIRYNDTDIITVVKNIIHNGSSEGICIIFQKLDVYKKFIRQSDDEIESAFLLKALMETTNDPIVYVNKEGYIELFSKAYAEFLEIKVEDAVGKHVTEVIENTRMHIVVKTGIPEYEEVQKLREKDDCNEDSSIC